MGALLAVAAIVLLLIAAIVPRKEIDQRVHVRSLGLRPTEVAKKKEPMTIVVARIQQTLAALLERVRPRPSTSQAAAERPRARRRRLRDVLATEEPAETATPPLAPQARPSAPRDVLEDTAELEAVVAPQEEEPEQPPDAAPVARWYEAVLGPVATPPSPDELVRVVSALGTIGEPWCLDALRAARQVETDPRVANAIQAVLEHARA